jgi:hypothetical protein
VTALVIPLQESLGLSTYQQIDFIEKFDTRQLPMHYQSFFDADVLVLLQNLDTRSGPTKGRRCSATELHNHTIVVQFDDGTKKTLPRIPKEKVINGIESPPLPVLSQIGLCRHTSSVTKDDPVSGRCRPSLAILGAWAIVRALSHVRNPHDLCVLLPLDLDNAYIKVPVDHAVVHTVQPLTVPPSSTIAPDCVEIEEPAVPPTTSVDLTYDTSPNDDLSLLTGLETEAQELIAGQFHFLANSVEARFGLLEKDAEILQTLI